MVILIFLLTWVLTSWLVWEGVCSERFMKMDKLSPQVLLSALFRASYLKRKWNPGFGDSLRYWFVKAFRRRSRGFWREVECEFYMKTGAVRALWCSEIVHRCARRVLGTDGCVVGSGGAAVEAKLKWQVSRGQPDAGEQAFNMSRLFQQAQVFIYCFQQISLE